MALELAKQIIDSELARRAQLPTSWTKCPHCGTRLHSKGMGPRQIQTLEGFWRLYNQCFSLRAIAVLDFYHGAQNLWKAAAACLDGRTKKARQYEHIKYQQFKDQGLPLGKG